MNYEQLKNSILQEAIEGRLVPQDPNDEPASVLLDRIRDEKAKLVKEKKIKKDKNESRIYRTEDGHWMERFTDKKRPDVCIDEEIPFDIPETWEWCRLPEICSLLSRGKSPKYLDSDRRFPVFAQKCNLKEGGISLEQARFLDPSTVNKWPREFHLRTGDVLVNSTGTGTVGRTRLFNESCLGDYPFVVPDSHVTVIRTFKQISSNYIYAVISTKWIQDFFEDNLKGATNQKELYIAVLINLLIPLPPLSEQHRIVEKLEQILPKVEEYGKAQERLDTLNAELPEKLRTSILQEAIEGRLVPQDPNDEPAAVLLDRIRDEKAKLVKEKKIKKDKNESRIYRSADGHWMEHFTDKKRPDVCIDDEIPFDIPETWEWCRVNELGEIITGGTPSKLESAFYGKDFPFYKPTDLNQGINTINSSDGLSTLGYNHSRQLKANSILVTCIGATIGKTGLIKRDGSCNQQINAIVPNTKLLEPRYVYMVFISNFMQSDIKSNASSTTLPILNRSKFCQLLFPIPPLSEQHRIVEKLESILPMLDTFKKR